MKKLIAILTLLVSIAAAHGQLVFEKIFDISGSDAANDMILTSDNSLLICGTNLNGSVLIKTDLDGNLIWQKEMPSLFLYRVIESQSGIYYLAGSYSYKPFLLKINSDGDSVWSYTGDAQPQYPQHYSSIKQNEAGKLLISGYVDFSQYSTPPSAYTVISDTVWDPFCETDYFVDKIILQNIFTNDTIYTLWTDCYSWGIGINTYNNYCQDLPSWYYDVIPGSTVGDFVMDTEGKFYIGTLNLVKTNSSGSVIWTLDPVPDLYFYINSLILSGEKIFSTGGYVNNLGNHEFFIFVCDTSGSFNTLYTDNSYLSQSGDKLIEFEDGIYIAGNVKTDLTNWDIFLRKYSKDSLLTGTNSFRIFNNRSIIVYPNPASNYVEFKVQGLPAGKAGLKFKEGHEIRIYNLYGEEVASLPLKAERTIWDCRDVPDGVYIYALDTGKEVARGKVVVTK